MSTITLPNIRVGSDLQVRARLKDGGVAIDWSTLQNIKACIYSDAQRALAGRCAFSIDEEDSTLLVCTYAANKPQYLGVNRIVISAKYMGETKTYDKPAFSFVRWTADQEGEEITIDDPDVDVEIDVEDISSSILQEAVDAAFEAAERANDAAAAAEHMVDIHTGPEGKSAYEVAVEEGYTGTEEEWLASLVGPQGQQGIQGETGAAAGFGTVSVSLQEDGGQPSATVAASGTDTAKNFAFTFNNLKGDKGDKGDQGNSGYQGAAGELEVVNNLTDGGSTAALSAEMGKTLEGEVSQLEAKVDDISTGKYYGYYATAADLPDDATVDGFAYVGSGPTYTIYNCVGGVWTSSDVTVNQSPIGNDEDIDQNEDGKLQFANRTYNSIQPNGMGYKILRKEATFASQVTDTNTIYEIRYNFDLNGGTVNIPSGCVLRFNGGAVSNGSIVYNNTEIQGEPIISCTCTGSLRNTVVTPQMYGAKGDGITDDNVALNNAANYNDCLFIPAGIYATTEPISMHSGMTLFGVGRESVIKNTVSYGFNKVCVFSGGMQVGTNTGSFLNLTPYACTVSSDRMSIETADTSPFNVGDLVFICKDETYTTKNPPRFWNGKIVGITENVSLKLDAYIDNEELVGVSCLVRDMAILPQGGGYFRDFITENICIHDLSLINSVDSESGMYVMAIGSYGAEIYNIWAHGSTIIGSNYLVNATIRNVIAEFDGGFIDVPEINQCVEVAGCRARRFGERLNNIGITFLQGYKAFVHDNNIDFGGIGKVAFGNHIQPIVKNNVFLNLYMTTGRPIELSTFGRSIFSNNRLSSAVSTSIINAGVTTGNVITDNYIDNPNSARWLESFNTFDFGENLVVRNQLTTQTPGDAQYYNFPNTRIATFIPIATGVGTTTISAGNSYSAFSSPKKIFNAKIIRITIFLSKGNYEITFSNSAQSGATSRTITLTNGSYLQVIIFATSMYINYYCDGDTAGSGRAGFNNHGTLQGVSIKNTGESDASLYACVIESVFD